MVRKKMISEFNGERRADKYGDVTLLVMHEM
jgi:hypothetical protein